MKGKILRMINEVDNWSIDAYLDVSFIFIIWQNEMIVIL